MRIYAKPSLTDLAAIATAGAALVTTPEDETQQALKDRVSAAVRVSGQLGGETLEAVHAVKTRDLTSVQLFRKFKTNKKVQKNHLKKPCTKLSKYMRRTANKQLINTIDIQMVLSLTLPSNAEKLNNKTRRERSLISAHSEPIRCSIILCKLAAEQYETTKKIRNLRVKPQ